MAAPGFQCHSFQGCRLTAAVAPVQQAHQGAIQSGDVSVGKACCCAPEVDDYLLNELLWAVALVEAGLGQVPALHGLFEFHSIEHAFQKGQTTPSGDFAASELQIERCLQHHGGPKSQLDRWFH
jgi:hypothetical protein